MPLRRSLWVAAAVLGAMCAGPAAAFAHPLLVQAAPQPGVVSPRSPTQLELAFSEPLVARGSRVTITGPGGRRVASGPIVAHGESATVGVGRLASAVYRVKWVALGEDGHTVSGSYAFGVAGRHGAPPPGAQALAAGGGPGSRGSERAAEDSVVAVVARWLGLLAASILAGGLVLVAILRRRVRGPDPAGPWRSAAPLVFWVVVGATIEGALAATAAPGGRFDLGLLTASPTGRAELARMAAVLAATALLAATTRRRGARDLVYGAGGAAVLVTYSLSGHVLAVGRGRLAAEALQVLHVLSAGLWVGGVATLVLLVARGAVPGAAAARAFAPFAAAALVVAGVTGVLAAVREVDHWYFLRWSGYGRVILIKTALVVLLALAGAVAAARGRRGRAPRSWLLRSEAVGLAAVLALASLLGGLAQGRGRPLPAQSGTLLPGPALATALTPRGAADLVLAPARAGANSLAVSLAGARSASVRLTCDCSRRAVSARLAPPRGPGAAWAASVRVPADGDWFASLTADGRRAASPVALHVGVPRAPGAAPVEVLSIADLSGPDAERCADHELGLELAIGRINGDGGLEGGHKVAPLVLDDGGSPARARSLARAAIVADHPIALAAACGGAAGAAVQAASAAGLPSIVADPAVGPVRARDDFRLAGDPYAEGDATGQYVRQTVAHSAAPGVRTVLAVDGGDDQAARRLDGLRTALASSDLRVRRVAASAVAGSSRAGLERLLDRRHALAVLLDGPAPAPFAAALHRLPSGPLSFPPAPVIASARVYSERFVESSGTLGRLGAVQGTAEVSPDSRDALAYAGAVPALYPGRRPSLDGLRGYLAGLALRQALRAGTSPAAIAGALRRPAPFTDALSSPWRDDAPSAGSQRFSLLAPSFLPSTLIPVSAGGESYDGSFFPDGAWMRLSTELYGPPLELPVPPLGGS